MNETQSKDDKGNVVEVTMVIHKVSKADEGIYTCKAIEGSGLEESKSYHLKLPGE